MKNKVIRATYSGRVIKKDDNYIDINKTQFQDDKAKLDWYSKAEVYEIRKFGKDVMNLCSIIVVISSLILIPVLIFNNISDVAPVILVMGILFVVCMYGIVSGYQQHKYPEKYTIETRRIYGSNWNMKYLERLPKEDNTYKIKLNADEKVVFTAIMQRLLTGSGECLGESVKFILTNQRIVADYDANVLKINISKDLLDYRKEKNRKNKYFKVLVDEVMTSEKKTKKSAIYIFEFNNEDTIKFEEILYNISIHDNFFEQILYNIPINDNNYDSTIIYKNKGYTWGEACENYCKQFNRKKEELSEVEERVIWDYSYSDINYLLMWIIENNFYVYTDEVFYDKNEWLKFIKEIKDRKAVPTDFMLQTEGYLDKEEISKDIWSFIDEYYLNDKSSDGNHVVSEENAIGLYEVHLDNFARNILKKEVYGFGFKWEEYDRFKIVIDNAYKKFKNIQQNKV